jgi:cob(I)alamin adenosyltransferase
VSIATRKGDEGTTGLLHGQRVPKDHPQIEALGAFDALNVEVGAARMLALARGSRDFLGRVQASLIAVMGELACAEADASAHATSRFARLAEGDLGDLDAALSGLESQNISMDGWATPGANPQALALDRARVAARTAERRLAALPAAGRTPRPLVLQWTNRLSDVLWLMARQAESQAPKGDA